MSLEYFNRERNCPCGSDLTAGACCFPEKPSLVRTREGFTSLNLQFDPINVFGEVLKHNGRITAEVVMNQPHQVEMEVETPVDEWKPLVERAMLIDMLGGEAVSSRIMTMLEALYEVRYHQTAFLFRLFTVTSDQTLAFPPPTGNVAVRINDRPLRFEMQAFLISAKGCLDAVAKATAFAAARKEMTWGGMVSSFAKHSQPKELRGLENLITSSRGWTAEITTIRNAVAHGAEFESFQEVGHSNRRFIDAKVGGVYAGQYAVKTWARLASLVGSIPHALLDVPGA